MNLAKQAKQTAVPKAISCGTEILSRIVSSSEIHYDIERLAGRRIEASKILSDWDVQATLASAIETIIKCISHNRKLMAAGNGGSASQAQHLCSELMGRFRERRSPIKAVSLNSDVSLLTCIANDFGYERVFSRQVEGMGETGDVFVAFTTSGKSRNVIEALLECKSRGLQSIVFSGKPRDTLSHLADTVISVPSEDAAIIQEMHLQLVHIVCETVERQINLGEDAWLNVLELGSQGYGTLILDRDGVINHVKANGYVQSPGEFSFRPDFVFHIKELSRIFAHILVVTNQKGVGKGLISMEDVQAVHNWMAEEIGRIGGRIDKIYVSTSPDDKAPTNKPNIGMGDLIRRDFPDVDFSKTVIVGDSASDYLFAENLGSRFIYVRTR